MADNPVDIQAHLAGVNYPATKQELIDKAKEENASDDVISVLQQLPERRFNSPTEVSRAVSALQ